MDKEKFQSPLDVVINEPKVHETIEKIRNSVYHHHPVVISKEEVANIRESFSRAIQEGERNLHYFSLELKQAFNQGSKCNICLNVYGRCVDDSHARLMKQEVWYQESEGEKILFSTSDSTLANSYSPWCILCNRRTRSVASSIDYYPESPGLYKLVFLRSRIKSTSNIAYKISDIVLDVDLTFKRDKIYNRYSQQVKDIYGIKAVVVSDQDLEKARNLIVEVPGVIIIEEKNYTGNQKKQSGFEAHKIVLEKQQQVFEIQIQSNRMFDEERLNWSTSHRTYKEKQLQQRIQLGREYLKLYETLVLLLEQPAEYQEIAKIELGYSQKGMDDEF